MNYCNCYFASMLAGIYICILFIVAILKSAIDTDVFESNCFFAFFWIMQSNTVKSEDSYR